MVLSQPPLSPEASEPTPVPDASFWLKSLLNATDYGFLFLQGSPGKEAISTVNKKFTELFRIPQEKLIGSTLKQFVALISPLLIQSHSSPDLLPTLLAPELTAWSGEFAIAKPNHQDFSISLTPVPDSNGSPTGFIIAVRDITHDKHLEEQALHTQKMQGLGTLAGGIAHDFNNILTAILGFSTALKPDLKDNPQAAPKLDQIIKGAHRAAELTRNLLAFSRKNPHLPRILDLNKLIEKTVNMLEFAMPDSITLSMELDPNIPYIEADPSQIQQLITQLAVNARDAIFTSGNIHFCTRIGYDSQVKPGDIPVTYIVIDVEDDGIGIPTESLNRIFEPFYTTKETGRGIGLGLAMVYGVVKQHFGFVEVESAPNMGSRFSIFLPSTEAQPEESTDAPTPIQEATQPEQVVLVIDDEEDLLTLCSVALADKFKKVLTAKDGVEGIQIFQNHTPNVHLILLDLTMPNMNGAECFENLRKIDPDIPVIISSGFSKEMGADELMEQGANGFLQKPYTIGSLLSKIEEVQAALKRITN